MKDFSALGLPKSLLHNLEKMNFTTPTPIQAAAIPHALKGRDILGSAQTGTGKTGAFGIPLLQHLMNNKDSKALIMTPTRELAAQVLESIRKMIDPSMHIKTSLLIGGESMFKQLQQLKGHPRLIVGTPGRINDHLRQRSLRLDMADFLVLDETDKMLDMGFEEQIDTIIKTMPKKRQSLMFSATLPQYIIKMSEKYLVNPQRVAMGATHAVAPKIKQELIRVNQPEKYTKLMAELQTRPGSIIVFVKTKRNADRLAKKLNDDGQSADAIHGDLNQNKRNRVIEAYRGKKYRILVATDVAARGLDIPHIEHVINYDLPQVAEDYIHRIGRTARAGAEGSAVCFITTEDREKWAEIDQLLNPGAPRSTESYAPQKSSGAPKRKFGKSNGQSNRDRKPFGQKRPSQGGSASGGGFKNKERRPFGEKRFDDKKKERGDAPSRGGERKSFGDKPRFSERSDDRRDARRDDRRDDRRSGGQGRDSGAGRQDRDRKPFGEKRYSDRSSGGGKPGERRSFGDRAPERREGGVHRGRPASGGGFKDRREDGFRDRLSSGGFKKSGPRPDSRRRDEDVPRSGAPKKRKYGSSNKRPAR